MLSPLLPLLFRPFFFFFFQRTLGLNQFDDNYVLNWITGSSGSIALGAIDRYLEQPSVRTLDKLLGSIQETNDGGRSQQALSTLWILDLGIVFLFLRSFASRNNVTLLTLSPSQ